WEIVTEAELQLVGAATITSTIEVVAIEDVETSIGVFKDCVKVETNRKAVTAITIVREREILWLAPDVGPVKFLDDTRGIVFDLASYNLVEPAAEEMPAAEDMQPTEETTEETTEEAAEEVTEETTEEITEEVTEETTEETVEEGTEVEVPAEPMVEEPMMPKAWGFDVTLEPGLNMISIPLMPEEPYTAKSLAAMLEATLVIRLDLTTQQFSAYTSLDEGDGFGIDGGMGYIVNTPAGGMVKFTGKAWDNQPEAADDAPAAPTLSTNKNTWAFVVTSDIRDMATDTGYILVAKNLRTGTIATETVTSEAKRSAAVWADLNRKSVVEAGDKLEIVLYDERGNTVSGPFQRTVSTADIRNAFLSLQLTVGDVRPKDTILAQNYPNPFNPETWIPYQLSKSAEVSIHIHNVAGHLIRTLDLGLKPIGSYMTPSTAAYWDGKNSVGERVSSGIYFYTLQTTDFAATRRMVILK
ncbi:MAG: T9SS type A sorting domain-containing protein, partial [Candidatus Poribacteria bacterium]|nr:T9SS type A sorting domain-containing protein [Candidatus Poribacteria bacterium]